MSIARKVITGDSGGVAGGDPYFYNVSFLMENDGVQNGNNNEIRGADGYTRTLTPQGGQIVQGTITPYGDQGSSGWWPGDAWLAPSNSWAPANRNITIECWVKTPHKVPYQTIMGSYDNSVGWGFCISGGGQLVFFINSNVVQTAATDVCDDQWHHIAVSRNGSSFRLFVDGVIDKEFGNSSSLVSPEPVRVGSLSASLPRIIKGFFTDIRYSDTLIYWNEFTPPTEPLSPDGGTTAVLTDFSRASIYDIKQNVNLYTARDTKVDTDEIRTKFPPSSVWMPTNSYMQGYPANRALHLGGNDYTIEGWFRFESNNEISLFELSRSNNKSVSVWVKPRTQISLYAHSGTPVVFPVTWDDLVTDVYYHIAVSKSQGVTRLFVDGNEIGSTPDTLSGDYDVLTFGYPKTGLNYFAGQIDGFRITKGVARYTANFTPPTEPFPIESDGSAPDDPYAWVVNPFPEGHPKYNSVVLAAEFEGTLKDDISGGDILDEQSCHAFIDAGPVWGNTKKAVSFLKNGRLQIGTGVSINNFTFSAWVFIKSSPVNELFRFIGDANSAGTVFMMHNGSTLQIALSYTSSNNPTITFIDLPDSRVNEWNYIVVSAEPTGRTYSVNCSTPDNYNPAYQKTGNVGTSSNGPINFMGYSNQRSPFDVRQFRIYNVPMPESDLHYLHDADWVSPPTS